MCLNEFKDNNELHLPHRCSHIFHLDYIDTLLTSHVTCHVYRANLVDDNLSLLLIITLATDTINL
ncbi:hypothetical protein MUK42_18388 [Musa troglodytarum]|uniref:RING-type E3 ubiquitin transferase n=1 Tax=Musa troglodytarum TaxID=320322 RepID=A0A9E7FWV1_9LILI|nr:hypothetical protein MUK42_18388 [Musa troglodytarum]